VYLIANSPTKVFCFVDRASRYNRVKRPT